MTVLMPRDMIPNRQAKAVFQNATHIPRTQSVFFMPVDHIRAMRLNRLQLMISILLDLLAAYFIRRKFTSKVMYLLLGFFAGILSSTIGSFLVGFWVDESPGQILLRAISGVIPHTLFIYISLLVGSWESKRREKKKAAIELSNASDKYWEENEQVVITNILENYRTIDLAIARNQMLEENLTKLSTEEIVDRLNKKNFSDDAIPSALRVLRNRLEI
jgi:hypothetical protein